jgi:CheY-like chemotaxis protein
LRTERDRPRLARKSYSKPECVAQSAPEIAHLLHEKLAAQLPSGKRQMCGGERLAPILFVQDYSGSSRSIQDVAESQNLRSCSCAAPDSSASVGRLCEDFQRAGADRPDFLVFDLRAAEGNTTELQREIRSEARLDGVPLVILTSGDSDSEALGCRDGAWRITGVSDPAQVVQALRALLHLWAQVLKLSPSPVLEIL